MSESLKKLISQTNKIKLFIGIGNVLKSDDGVGVYICNHIKENHLIQKLNVEISIENYLGKINSLQHDVLILIDCVDFGKHPGYYELLPAQQVKDFTLNTHNISLKRISELFMKPVFILGTQPNNIGFGEELSVPVLKTAKEIIEIINK